MQNANYFVVYSLSPKGSVIRWDYAYEVHKLDKTTLPLFGFLDWLDDFTSDPTMNIPFLTEVQNQYLTLMLYVWKIVSNAELPPALEIQNRVVVFESESDKAYRKGFVGLF